MHEIKLAINTFSKIDGYWNNESNPFIKESLKYKNKTEKDNKNKDSKFNGKPLSKFNNEDGKEIDITFIEESKSGIYRKKTNNFWYKKFLVNYIFKWQKKKIKTKKWICYILFSYAYYNN